MAESSIFTTEDLTTLARVAFKSTDTRNHFQVASNSLVTDSTVYIESNGIDETASRGKTSCVHRAENLSL